MTEEEVERRANALADLIREFDLVEDAGSAKSEAYWIVDALHDPAGELGLWRAKDQVKLLDQALSGLSQAEKALESLAPPVKTAISRHTRIGRGFLIPPSAEKALAARRIRLEHLRDISAFQRSAPEDQPAEDVADPAKEITVHVVTLQQSAPALVQTIRKALENNRKGIESVIMRERRTSAEENQRFAEAKMRLDGRRWSAILSFLWLSNV